MYLDKKLITKKIKKLISKFLDFKEAEAGWERDHHYTTSTDELDKLFRD